MDKLAIEHETNRLKTAVSKLATAKVELLNKVSELNIDISNKENSQKVTDRLKREKNEYLKMAMEIDEKKLVLGLRLGI